MLCVSLSLARTMAAQCWNTNCPLPAVTTIKRRERHRATIPLFPSTSQNKKLPPSSLLLQRGNLQHLDKDIMANFPCCCCCCCILHFLLCCKQSRAYRRWNSLHKMYPRFILETSLLYKLLSPNLGDTSTV